METIFDHNPTDSELKAHFSRAIGKEEYMAAPLDQTTEYALIYSLYKMRGDEATAARYRALLPANFVETCLDLNDIVPTSKA